MELHRQLTTVSNLVATCCEVETIKPKQCYELVCMTVARTADSRGKLLTEELVELVSDFYNGYNADFGRYAKKVLDCHINDITIGA